jgi:hypothetical protein
MPLLQFLQGLLFEKGIFENLFWENFIHRKVGFSFPIFLKPFCKIPASKGFQFCLKDFFIKSLSLKKVFAKICFKTLLVLWSSRFSPYLGDIQTPTKSSVYRRYGGHDQELHTPLLPRTCALN